MKGNRKKMCNHRIEPITNPCQNRQIIVKHYVARGTLALETKWNNILQISIA